MLSGYLNDFNIFTIIKNSMYISNNFIFKNKIFKLNLNSMNLLIALYSYFSYSPITISVRINKISTSFDSKRTSLFNYIFFLISLKKCWFNCVIITVIWICCIYSMIIETNALDLFIFKLVSKSINPLFWIKYKGLCIIIISAFYIFKNLFICLKSYICYLSRGTHQIIFDINFFNIIFFIDLYILCIIIFLKKFFFII